jgi:hypothetical protein
VPPTGGRHDHGMAGGCPGMGGSSGSNAPGQAPNSDSSTAPNNTNTSFRIRYRF